jgi:hypothetical protein
MLLDSAFRQTHYFLRKLDPPGANRLQRVPSQYVAPLYATHPSSGATIMFSRRELLTVSAAAAAMVGSSAQAATFGNPDRPPQGAVNAKSPENLTDPGPQNPDLAKQFPSLQSPPATDVGGLPMDWASFNIAPKRIQNGGWAR